MIRQAEPEPMRCLLKAKGYKDFEAWCREHGHRATDRRRTVAKIVLASRDYPNMDELCSRIRAANPRISLPTVYRTLRLLADFGVIERHTFGEGPARYGPAPREHQDHLIDVASGTVIEFHSDKIERLQREVVGSLGYRLTGHTLELYGVAVRATKAHRPPIGGRRSLRSTRD